MIATRLLPAQTLWIDGVGGVRFLFGEEIRIGHAIPNEPIEDDAIRFLSNLSRDHARLFRREGGYLLRADRECHINGELVRGSGLLFETAEVRLGDQVKLRFRQPNVLTNTAVIQCLSGHPSGDADYHVLMESNCIVGEDEACHLRGRRGFPKLILFKKESGLAFRAATPVTADGHVVANDETIRPHTTYEIGDFRFHWDHES